MSNSAKTVWGLNEEALIKAEVSSSRFKLKHGMFAGIPLICKNQKCPYLNVCTIPDKHRVTGERCPIEIGAIMTRFESWCRHFGIDATDDYIKDEDLVDASLIRDLVDNEIQILRADNRIAINGDFIARTISTIDNKGKAYYEDCVSKEAEFKLQLLDKRYKILQLLNSTRKDKAKEVKLELNPSQQAMSIFKKISEKVSELDLDSLGE